MSNANLTLEAASAPSSGLPATISSHSSGAFGGWSEQLLRMLRQPAIARALPTLMLLGVVGLAALAWMTLREPPQRDLFRGLGDADKGAVASQLDKSGISYDFDSSGAITVSESDYFKAKMDLAAAGLPKSAPDGGSIIDNLPMGASRAVEGEKLRSARELDLARTIEAIDAVQSARVHLAVEAPSVFLRDQSRPSASVMLRLADGRALSNANVQAIVHLVASSVSELTPDAVSVVDQSGKLLTGDGAGGENDRQLSVQAQVEDRYRQQVVALLTPILGAGKFSAEVHAEMNFAERQATRETYPQDEARLRAEVGSWQADGLKRPEEAGGIPGALSATPPPAGQVQTAEQAAQAAPATGQTAAGTTTATPGAPPVKTEETFNRSFELGREVSVTKDASGTVRRLSVAVALDNANGKPRGQAEVAALEALVKGAIGFDQSRGDVVAVSSRAFAALPAEEKTPWHQASWVSMLVRNLSALLVAVVIILGVGRPLLKRRSAAREAGDAVRSEIRSKLGGEISAELSRNAGFAAPSGAVTLDMISSTQSYTDRAALIRDFVKQDPDRAALVVRDLLKEGARDHG